MCDRIHDQNIKSIHFMRFSLLHLPVRYGVRRNRLEYIPGYTLLIFREKKIGHFEEWMYRISE
jgi:hypothetical protein